MSGDGDLADLPIAQRVVLLNLAHRSRVDESPAHTGQIVQSCTRRLEGIDVDALGRLGEADVSRALNRLEADGYVEAIQRGERSPVGKGRPVFRLTVDADAVVDACRSDDRLAELVEAFARSWS